MKNAMTTCLILIVIYIVHLATQAHCDQVNYYVNCDLAVSPSGCPQDNANNPYADISDALACCTDAGNDYSIFIRGSACNPVEILNSSVDGESILLTNWPLFNATIKHNKPKIKEALAIKRFNVTVDNITIACDLPDCQNSSAAPPFYYNNDNLGRIGVFLSLACNTVIKNCDIKGFGKGIDAQCVACIPYFQDPLGTTGIVFQDNTIHDNTVGIWIQHTPKTLFKNEIYDNMVGIQIGCSDNDVDGVIYGSTVQRNYIHHNTLNGIRIDQFYFADCSYGIWNEDVGAPFQDPLRYIGTTIIDNVISQNGLTGPQFPATPAYTAGSGITMFEMDLTNPCYNDDPDQHDDQIWWLDENEPGGEIRAKLYNNLFLNNQNGIILTCGSNPTIENNLIIQTEENSSNYGIIIDNDSTLTYNPGDYMASATHVWKGGPCTLPLAPGTWSDIPPPICHVPDIEPLINMNTIDGFNDDGIYLTKTNRHGFETSNRPHISNTTTTNNGGFGVNCDYISSTYPVYPLFYSFVNSWNNRVGQYSVCGCSGGDPICMIVDPLFCSGNYPSWPSSLPDANAYYLNQGFLNSPLIDLVDVVDSWYQDPFPAWHFKSYTDPQLSTYDQCGPGDLKWDIGFHYLYTGSPYDFGNWFDVE